MAREVNTQIEIAASPERVFRAWTTDEVAQWWGQDDMYRVTTWSADLRPGGKWRSDGVHTSGEPFFVEGEYVEVQEPNKLSFTWKPQWEPGTETLVKLEFIPSSTGTLLKLNHCGFTTDESQAGHNEGWSRVLAWMSHFVQQPEKVA